jgi:cytochrome c
MRRGATYGVGAVVVVLLASAAARAQGDPVRGEQRFQDCAACHATQPGVNTIGPSLAGIFDRKAATAAEFRYSPALRRSGITWTAETIDAFIADPQKVVPNNRMPYAGMPQAGDRADLIAYLSKAARQ